MTITQYRDRHQPTMKDETHQAGRYLETQGLIFGHDFTTGDAIDLASAFMTRKFDEDEKDKQLEAFSKMYDPKPNRFQDEDWEERFA